MYVDIYGVFLLVDLLVLLFVVVFVRCVVFFGRFLVFLVIG